jgi:signal transduction histidine kinase
MPDISLINSIIIFLINIIGIFMVFWVYFADKKGGLNRQFPFLVIGNLVWVDTYYFAFLMENPYWSLLLTRLTFSLTLIFCDIFFYFFIIWFLNEKGIHIKFAKLFTAYVLIVGAISVFSSLIIEKIEIGRWGVIPVFSYEGIIFFHLPVLSVIVFSVIKLIRNYVKSSKDERLKVQYFLIGASIFALGNAVIGIILPLFFGLYDYYFTTSYFTVFLLGFTALAIVKQKLFGVNVVITYLLVGLISLLLILDILFLTTTVQDKVFQVVVLFIFLILGRSLINSVKREIEQREKLTLLNSQLDKVNFDLKDLNDNLQEKVDEQTREIKRAYDVEKKARIELEELDKSKTQFILSTEHHLRTPLTISKGFLEAFIAKESQGLSEEGKSYLNRVSEATNRIMTLVNELLEVSQMGVGKGILKLELINIKDLIADLMDGFKADLKTKQIKTTIFFSEDSKGNFLNLDKEKITEAMTNLISNAVKYNKIGGEINVIGKITTNDKNQKFYQVSIEDQGIGIKPEDVSKIFSHVFERSEEAKKLYATGKGIGLAVVKSVVEAHGGTVRAESDGEGKGSRFIAELPMQ